MKRSCLIQRILLSRCPISGKWTLLLESCSSSQLTLVSREGLNGEESSARGAVLQEVTRETIRLHEGLGNVPLSVPLPTTRLYICAGGYDTISGKLENELDGLYPRSSKRVRCLVSMSRYT